MVNWGPFSLSGKRAVVTGGAMGIGKGIVSRFLEAGARVLVVDKAAEQLTKSVGELERNGEVHGMVADLEQDDSPQRIVAEAVERLGGLDILVNNAGIYPIAPMLEMPQSLFDRVYRINLRALAFLSREAAKQMIRQGGGGKIVNIASIDSIHPGMGLVAYDSSKGGVLMFTKSFALEVARYGIHVNAIAPGVIATEGSSLAMSSVPPEQVRAAVESLTKRIPLGRMGTPDDIAKVAVFLASPASDYMTGSLIIVDGGILLT